MKDASNEVIKAFYTALNGNTTLPVYTMVPDNVNDFIYIDQYNGNEDSANDAYITRASLQIEFVKRYTGQGSRAMTTS